MNRKVALAAGLAAAVLSGVVQAADSALPATTAVMIVGPHPYGVYAAAPCGAPTYGLQGLAPACCQSEPSRCADAWAGYCQQKACGGFGCGRLCFPAVFVPRRLATVQPGCRVEAVPAYGCQAPISPVEPAAPGPKKGK